jgi:hypothetical protein
MKKTHLLRSEELRDLEQQVEAARETIRDREMETAPKRTQTTSEGKGKQPESSLSTGASSETDAHCGTGFNSPTPQYRGIKGDVASMHVGVGGLLTLSALAWNVYKLCRDSSPQYQGIKDDVTSMHAVIKETEELEGLNLKPEQQERLAKLKKNCQDVLLDLKKMVDGYESLGTQQQRTWDRMKWGLEPVTEIKQRLVSTTTALGAFSSMLVKYDILPSKNSRSPYIKLHDTVPHQLEL